MAGGCVGRGWSEGEKRGAERNGEGFLYLLLKFIDAIGHVLVPGVVDQDVDRPHPRHGFLDELLAILSLGDVGRV